MTIILNLFLFSFCYYFVFGILATKFLKGLFYKCYSLPELILEELHDKEECMDNGGDWIRLDAHFDNILFSIQNLFATTIYEGSSFIMF